MGWIARKLFAGAGIVCGLAVVVFVCAALFVGGGKALEQIVPWAIAGARSGVWRPPPRCRWRGARARNSLKWGVLTFLVWPALLVLLFLKPAAGAVTAETARPWWSAWVEAAGVVAVTGLLVDLVYAVAVILRSLPDGG